MTCVSCEQKLAVSLFRTMQGAQGIRVYSSCKPCEKQYAAERYRTHKAAADASRLKNIDARRERAREYMRQMRSERGAKYARYRSYLRNRAHIVRAMMNADEAATAADIMQMGEHQKWLCIGCGENIEVSYWIDHKKPIAKGGDHSPANLQLLCAPCNMSKGARENWVPPCRDAKAA